jgi:anti-sigma-K factor RskA
MGREHEQYEESVGAYLLGALPEHEAAALERHLAECVSCREELERLRVAAEALPTSVTQLRAPATLTSSLMQIVRRDALERSGAPRRSLRSLFPEGLPRIRPALAWASAVVLLAAGGLAGYAVTRLTESESSWSIAASVNRGSAPEAGGSLLIYGHDGRQGILRVHGLPETSADHVYVIWLERGGETIAESSFNVRPDGSGKGGIENLRDVNQVLVTSERSADVRSPSGAPLLRVRL